MSGFALFLVRRLPGIAVLGWVVTLAAFGLFRLGVPSELADRQINAQPGQGESASWQYAGSRTDRTVTGATLTAAVVPTFLVAVLLLDLFSYIARTGFLWLQPGYEPLAQDPGAWPGRMILPWIALAAAQAGLTARLTRTTALEVLGEDYIRTAYAKGLSRRRVFWCHVPRPSLVPLLPSVGVGLGTLLGSAAIVDQTFALGGVGQALLTAAKDDDLMVIMGTVLITVIVISLVNLVVDVCQSVLDPRVRLA